MKQIFYTLFVLLSMNLSSQAQTWNGTVSNVWTNPLNWTPNTVPGVGSSVSIGVAPNAPKLQANTSIGLINTSGGSLDFNGFTLTVGGILGYSAFNNTTLNNSSTSTDIIINLNNGSSGYNSQINGCTINDKITINLTGTDVFYEGGTTNTFNDDISFNINGGGVVYTSYNAISQFNGNFNFNRTVAGTSYIFNVGANITGNVNIQNAVGGITDIGHSSNFAIINGTINMNVSNPTPSGFSFERVKNLTPGGTINIQNTVGFTIQYDSLKINSFTVQGYEGNSYAYFYFNKIDGNLIMEDDINFNTGYHTEVRNNTITGNTSYTIKGTNQFNEANSGALSSNTYNGGTTFNINSSASVYISNNSKSIFNGNLSIYRTVAGYNRFFNAGATIIGNLIYNNTASGDNDLGNLSNLTSISGTVNMNINLSPIGRFEMYRLVNQTPGGKINVHNSRGFDVRNDSLKVDSLNIVSYRGNAYGYFYDNQITGHLQIADSTSYANGYSTQIKNNTITGNTNYKIYGSNTFEEASTIAQPNIYGGSLTMSIAGNASVYTSNNAKSIIGGNYTVTRTAAGITRLFAYGAEIDGNFSFTKNAAGTTDIGHISRETNIDGTFNLNITQTNADDFSLHRMQNFTNGGSVSVVNPKGFDVQQDSLLTTSFSITGYGGSAYAYLYTNQITGNLTLQDNATYGGGYNTNLQNNTINGNSVITILGSNTLTEASAASQPNLFNGNVTFNANGIGSLYVSHDAKSTYNGNLTVNRTVAGYTRLFNFGADISGNFSYTKNANGGSDLGFISRKTAIGGTINLNVTQSLGDVFSMHRMQNLTNGVSVSVNSCQAFNVQQDSLLTTSFSINGYGGSQYAYLYSNQITGNLTLSDVASYGGGYNTNIQNNTITGNTLITLSGTNYVNEASAASQPNVFNGNVTFNANGSGALYVSHEAKSTYNGNLIINRTVAGHTQAFNFGANVNGNFSYTKNIAGASYLGFTTRKTAISGTINLNVTQTLGDPFEMFWIVNQTTGGTINVQNMRAFNLYRDSFKVASINLNNYGGGQYCYLNDNQIEGDFTSSSDISYGGGYHTQYQNNTFIGTTSITNNGPNIYYDGNSANSGNTFLGNVTYTRTGGAMNIATSDTNSYAGNLVFNNVTALPITAELIKFIGNTNTNIDQLGTGSIDIQKMILNKTSGAKLSLNKPVRITTSCAFLTGYINSTTTNPLIFPDNIGHNSASDNSHVIGCVTKAGNDIFTFPLGNGIGYHPLAITAPATTTDSFQACIILKHPNLDGYNVSSKDAALLQIAPYHYWTLNQINGTNSEAVSLGWSIPCANTVVASLPGLAVARWNGTQWNNLGNASTTGTTTLGTVTQTGTTTNFGVFALATTSALNSWQITSVTASASTICTGTSTTLTGAGAATYNWQPGNLSGTSVIVTPLTTTTYTVTGTSATGCITTATRTITVNPLPTPNAGADRIHTCFTPSTTIGTAGVAGTTYTWLPATGLTASNIAQPIANPVSTTTYTVTATITATGCTATDAVIVTVNKTPPTANAGVDKTNNCLTPSQAIGTASIAGNTYAWSPSLGLSAANIAQPNANPASTTTYTVTVTNTTNGCTAFDAVVVTVDKTPPTANAGADKTNNCISPSQIIGTAAVVGNTYSWAPSSGLSATNIAQPTANPLATTTYTVTVTNSTNGCTATDAVIVTVNKTPPTANAGVDKTNTCTTISQTIGTAAVVGNSYSWAPSSGLSASNIAQPVANPAATTSYTVTATNTTNGCTATDVVLVTVNKTPPTADAGADKTNTCTIPSQTIGTAAVVGNTYTWTPSSGLSATNIAQPTANPTSTTTYTVTVTNTTNGCTATDIVLVTVNKTPPSVGTTATSTTICAGASTTITGTNASTYVWQPGGQTTTSINVSPAITTTYTVTGTNTANGCSNTSTRVITVNALPNVGTTASATTICAGTPTTLTGTNANTYTWMPGSLSGTSVIVSPTTTTTYTVTGTNTTTGCTKTATRVITVNCSAVNLKLFIEGYYTGASTMTPVLFNQGVSASTSVADSITVELRNTTPPYAVVRTVKTLLNTNGTASCSFTPFVSGNYYIAVKNRNAIQTSSSVGVTVGTVPITYDFSNLITKAYNNNMLQVSTSPNVFAFYSGDINQDENVDLTDQSILDAGITNFLFGYQAADINGDGSVDILDSTPIETNINNFVFSSHPWP
ncbi:MAG TPA: hypothetical protein PLU17_04980 [Chitinophagaceae bacterium]|nr:hypothetical protein [Chitinophagaceae bacterium]